MTPDEQKTIDDANRLKLALMGCKKCDHDEGGLYRNCEECQLKITSLAWSMYNCGVVDVVKALERGMKKRDNLRTEIKALKAEVAAGNKRNGELQHCFNDICNRIDEMDRHVPLSRERDYKRGDMVIVCGECFEPFRGRHDDLTCRRCMKKAKEEGDGHLCQCGELIENPRMNFCPECLVGD